jgi:hypothetical protein
VRDLVKYAVKRNNTFMTVKTEKLKFRQNIFVFQCTEKGFVRGELADVEFVPRTSSIRTENDPFLRNSRKLSGTDYN